MCNYASAMIKDKHAAEDVVQAIFIQLWESDKLMKLENPEPYLLQCVRYKCIDHRRSLKIKKEQSYGQLPEMGIEEHSSIGEEDILPLMHFFAAKLPPKMRDVFLLSREKGLSYKDIAERMEISPKTVDNQMGSALKKLRELLKEHHYLSIISIFFQ